MKILRFLFSCFVLLAFTSPQIDVKLEYNFKVGDQFVWTQSTKQTIKQSIMGAEQNMTNDMSGEFKLKILENTATGAKLQFQYAKLRNVSTTPMAESVMDTDGEVETTENKVMKSIVNKPFIVYMTNLGEVEKIEGIDNLTSGLKDSGLDESELQMSRAILEQFFSESSLKASIQQTFVVYPDKKVKQGDSWNVRTQTGMKFPMALESKWIIENLSGVNANLKAAGTFVTTDASQIFELPGGFKAKSDLTGNQMMTSIIDIKTGWPTKQTVEGELNGKMTLLAGGMIPQDVDVPMEIVFETTNTLVKK